jgi:hypothetical protein
LVFERFTERARHVVALAEAEARTLKHNYIGTEHLLLGLVGEEEGLAARVLESLDITVERVRGQVVRIVGSGEEVTSGQIPFTPRAKKVLELALREALSLGYNYIGTEHILLGLVRDNEGVAARIMLDFDADSEKIRNEVIRMLAERRGEWERLGPPGSPGARLNPPASRLDWNGAALLWRGDGLELRIPLHVGYGAMAAFAADRVWSKKPLAGLQREIGRGWLSLASPSLLDDLDPKKVRRQLDAALARATKGRVESARAEEFLRRLREGQ